MVNSFSKYFSMTGWRVGWLVVPHAAGPARSSGWRRTSTSRRPTVAQVAALGAFDGIEELEANKRVYAENRALLLAELPKAGLERIVPADGAFYLYVDVGDFTSDSVAFTKEMLARHRRRRHARRRLRCRARQPLCALLLRRHDGGHGRSRAPAQRLEPSRDARVNAPHDWPSAYLQACARAWHS